MFRGQVSVVRTGLSGIAAWMLFLGAAGGCVLLLFLGKGLFGGMLVAVAVFVWLGYRYKLRPPKWVEATADDGGIFIDGVPLVLRKDIQQACIRPRQDAETIESWSQHGRTFLDLPEWPLTVEIIRRDGTPLNIDPGGNRRPPRSSPPSAFPSRCAHPTTTAMAGAVASARS
jgi:hypothetical protein